MLKKIAVFVLIAAVALVSVSAASSKVLTSRSGATYRIKNKSTLQLGVTAGYTGGDVESFKDGFSDYENYHFGGDVRLNLSYLSFVGTAVYSDKGSTSLIDAMISANIRLDIDFIEIAGGIGMVVPVEYNDDGVIVNGETVSDAWDVLEQYQLVARAAVGLNLGGLSLGGAYTVPVDSISDAFDNSDGSYLLEGGKISLSVLCKLF